MASVVFLKKSLAVHGGPRFRASTRRASSVSYKWARRTPPCSTSIRCKIIGRKAFVSRARFAASRGDAREFRCADCGARARSLAGTPEHSLDGAAEPGPNTPETSHRIPGALWLQCRHDSIGSFLA